MSDDNRYNNGSSSPYDYGDNNSNQDPYKDNNDSQGQGNQGYQQQNITPVATPYNDNSNNTPHDTNINRGPKQWGNKPDKKKWDPNKKSTIPVGLYLPYTLIVKSDVTLPDRAIELLTTTVRVLSDEGFILRYDKSSPIEQWVANINAKKETYIPFQGFNELESDGNGSKHNQTTLDVINPRASDMNAGRRAFMAGDIAMLAGTFNNSPSKMMIIYSVDGCVDRRNKSDTTGYALDPIAFANRLGVPVINLGSPHFQDEITSFIKKFF